MVLAYFMRKDYEAEIDTLLRNQEAQAEIAKAQAESIQAMRDIEFARQKQAEAERDAIREQNAVILQLLEQNRQMLEIIDQQRNGNGNHTPDAHPETSEPPASGAEPPNHPQE